jgi:Ca2+-transporting ATPase
MDATWAAVELGMPQRLLDTISLAGRQWGVVLLLSLIAPGFVWVDKTIQLARLRKREAESSLVAVNGGG